MQRAFFVEHFREHAREEDDLNIGAGWEYAGHEEFHVRRKSLNGEGWREPALNDGADVYTRFEDFDDSSSTGEQYRCAYVHKSLTLRRAHPLIRNLHILQHAKLANPRRFCGNRSSARRTFCVLEEVCRR